MRLSNLNWIVECLQVINEFIISNWCLNTHLNFDLLILNLIFLANLEFIDLNAIGGATAAWFYHWPTLDVSVISPASYLLLTHFKEFITIILLILWLI
jgi:hypothetical protein